MNRFFIPGSLFLLFFSFSCNNKREPENTSDIDPAGIYFDYQVRGEEGNELVTVLLQFRVEDSYGGTLALDPPSQVELDGKTLVAGSSRMTGTFYETQFPANQLAGTHTIVFTDANKKKYKEEFSFQPVVLLTAVPDTLHRNDLIFDFDGLESLDAIRAVIADTTYPGKEMDQWDTARNGRLVIKKEEIDSVANGPVQVLFMKENEIAVKSSPAKGGGRISFSYTIKREFILID